MELNQVVEESVEIRNAYHMLEEKYHGRKWNIQEDALAMSTDIGLISRLIMDEANIWPTAKDETYNLEYKIGEVVWWLAVISDKSEVDFNKAVEDFINKKKNDFNIK
ncbi:MazG-like protein [Mammaliicoccus sciuri]|uniref:MazG-like protein n=1 Tax=Mammaliicoccus sciuri TaxID=1296 RepID=UPI001E39C34E|nr:MazG-like protein [Mammaliicoccus sciuri]MCD8897859.1 MazG-like protein [Mammaliicoccus sciuri]